ncbi:MAG: polyphosphate kinase 2 family protein [Candidatus Dormibacteraeota bacterium]|nr:polyphosphate kinase 2 family protein [Candidatus Dormibacteraeota bacterium]
MSAAKGLRERLLVPPGQADFSLAGRDPADTAGISKKRARAATQKVTAEVAELQERLYAARSQSLLIVLQGMDTAGKDGAVKVLLSGLNPQGVHLKSFKAPTPIERRHHYLWRIRRELPGPGWVSVFNRSQYEDVLVVRVDGLAPLEAVERRYAELNRFEAALVAQGTTVVKFCLHLSFAEQRRRLIARLEDPTKWWKYAPDDIDKRAQWEDYQTAYDLALRRSSPPAAPWYVVPCDHKWFRDYAIAHLVHAHLAEIDPRYPEPDFDVAHELSRLGVRPARR